MGLLGHYLINLAAQGVGRLLMVGSSLTVFVLAARLLGVERFGEFSYIMALVMIGATLADLGTSTALAKGISEATAADAGRYWGNYLLLRGALSAVVTTIAIALVLFLVPPELPAAAIMVAALGIPLAASRFFEPLFQVMHRPWYTAYASLAFGVVYVAGAALAVQLSPRPVVALIAAYVAANAVYVLVAFSWSIRLLKPDVRFDWFIARKILVVAAPIGVATVFAVVNSRADIFMLKHMQSDYVVGLYNAAYKFVDMGALAAATLAAPLIPIFTKIGGADRRKLLLVGRRIVEIVAVFGIPCVLLVPLVAEWLITLLYGQDFSGAAPLLGIFGWVVLLVLYGLASSAMNVALGILRHAYWSGIVAASLNIALNYWWIPQYGAVGAAWATLCSEIVLVGISFYYTVRGLGSVFVVRRWLAIIACNAMLLIALGPMGLADDPLGAIAAVVGYAVAAGLMRLLPWAELRQILALATSPRNSRTLEQP